jgi:hypothetical protein
MRRRSDVSGSCEMKIKLIKDVPVEEKHGMTKGRVLDVIKDYPWPWSEYVYVMGDIGIRVRLFAHEYEKVEDKG